MKSSLMRFALTGLVVTVFIPWSIGTASAQCSTCATPTVAYQPVVAQTTVAYQPYTGWYPGKMLDNMRLRRYDRRYGTAAVVAPTYTAAYTPYTAAYTPYTAAYRPYVTSYAPLVRTTVARPVIQTSYYVPAVATNSCSSCVQTVARQVVMSPIVTSGCSVCQSGGIGCSTCASGVSQASYTQPACSSCVGGSTTPIYSAPAASGTPNTVGPNTGQPTLAPNEAIPSQSKYGSKVPDPAPAKEAAETDPYGLDEDKTETEAAPADTNTSFEAPRLLNPQDRTARRSHSSRVSVDVRNAVYSQPSKLKKVTQTSYKPTLDKSDADGWSSVSR